MPDVAAETAVVAVAAGLLLPAAVRHQPRHRLVVVQARRLRLRLPVRRLQVEPRRRAERRPQAASEVVAPAVVADVAVAAAVVLRPAPRIRTAPSTRRSSKWPATQRACRR